MARQSDPKPTYEQRTAKQHGDRLDKILHELCVEIIEMSRDAAEEIGEMDEGEAALFLQANILHLGSQASVHLQQTLLDLTHEIDGGNSKPTRPLRQQQEEKPPAESPPADTSSPPAPNRSQKGRSSQLWT